MLQNQGLRSRYFSTGLATMHFTSTGPFGPFGVGCVTKPSLWEQDSLPQAKEGHRGTQGLYVPWVSYVRVLAYWSFNASSLWGSPCTCPGLLGQWDLPPQTQWDSPQTVLILLCSLPKTLLNLCVSYFCIHKACLTFSCCPPLSFGDGLFSGLLGAPPPPRVVSDSQASPPLGLPSWTLYSSQPVVLGGPKAL